MYSMNTRITFPFNNIKIDHEKNLNILLEILEGV